VRARKRAEIIYVEVPERSNVSIAVPAFASMQFLCQAEAAGS
jgi:hypothetical protein